MIRIGGSTARAIRVEAETDETDRETDQLASGQMSEALPELVRVLTEEDAGSEKVKEAARSMRNIASGSDATREAVVAAGALAGLARVLKEAGPETENAQRAAQALLNIVIGPDALAEAVVAAGARQAWCGC